MDKLRRMLKQYNEFPAKYRALTWKFILELPSNKEAFEGLLNRGVHPAFKSLHKRYPIGSYRLYNKLVRILSCLGHWCPIFLDVDYLPSIVFPFVKSIPNDDLLVFEISVSILCNWMQLWFEGFPSEPVNLLQAVEDILIKEEPHLVDHFREFSFSPSLYAWPLLRAFFSEVLQKDDWLRFVDHLFTYKGDPELTLYFAAAFMILHKGQL